MSYETFDLNDFVKESKDVLVNPNYFSTMKTSGGMTEPLIKAVIYGAVAGIISFIWSFFKIGAISGGIFGGTVGIMVFIWAIIGSVFGLFIGAVILLVISSICKGTTDFEANVRVTSAVMVMIPISAFLGFATGLNLYIGLIVNLAVNMFALWLLYRGLTQALKANPDNARIVMYILVAIFVLFMIVGFSARRKADQFMRSFNNSDFKEMIKDIPKE